VTTTKTLAAEDLNRSFDRLLAVALRHPESALQRLQTLERKLRAQGDLAGAIDVLCKRFHLLEHRGRALELRDALTQAAGEARPDRHGAQAARVAEALGRIAYQQGNYLEATEKWSHALDLAEAVGDVGVSVAARIGLGQIHYAMGAWNSGLRFHRDAASRLESLDNSYLAAKVALNIGVGHFENGQREDAERYFSHGLAAARRGSHREFEGEAHWHLARAALARGELQWAIADCRLALDIAGKLHHHWLEASASRTWTEIALARGDESAAIRSTQHGLELAERIQSKPQQREAHLQLARLLERKGEYQAALQHLWQHVTLQAELERQTLPGRLGILPLTPTNRQSPDDAAQSPQPAMMVSKSPSSL
jgi:tetratricopeptide (TPR) repeat protein